jgi:hypothetical protein
LIVIEIITQFPIAAEGIIFMNLITVGHDVSNVDIHGVDVLWGLIIAVASNVFFVVDWLLIEITEVWNRSGFAQYAKW